MRRTSVLGVIAILAAVMGTPTASASTQTQTASCESTGLAAAASPQETIGFEGAGCDTPPVPACWKVVPEFDGVCTYRAVVHASALLGTGLPGAARVSGTVDVSPGVDGQCVSPGESLSCTATTEETVDKDNGFYLPPRVARCLVRTGSTFAAIVRPELRCTITMTAVSND